jgi:hypothetical protein
MPFDDQRAATTEALGVMRVWADGDDSGERVAARIDEAFFALDGDWRRMAVGYTNASGLLLAFVANATGLDEREVLDMVEQWLPDEGEEQASSA